MRCVVRIIILTCIAFFLLIYLAVCHANSKIVVSFDENDEEARRILDSAIPSQTSSNHKNHSSSTNIGRQSISVSVALVLIVSLISIALLITGIIIIAVTLDPSSSDDDDESDLEVDGKSHADYSPSDNGYFPYTYNSSNIILTEL